MAIAANITSASATQGPNIWNRIISSSPHLFHSRESDVLLWILTVDNWLLVVLMIWCTFTEIPLLGVRFILYERVFPLCCRLQPEWGCRKTSDATKSSLILCNGHAAAYSIESPSGRYDSAASATQGPNIWNRIISSSPHLFHSRESDVLSRLVYQQLIVFPQWLDMILLVYERKRLY